MNKDWMPKTAGILNILYGGGGAWLGGFGAVFLSVLAGGGTGGIMITKEVILWALLIPVGGLAIVGGIYAFKRKRWWLALTGSIAAIVPAAIFAYFFWPLFDPRYPFSISSFVYLIVVPAIVAVVLIVISRKQFEGQ